MGSGEGSSHFVVLGLGEALAVDDLTGDRVNGTGGAQRPAASGVRLAVTACRSISSILSVSVSV